MTKLKQNLITIGGAVVLSLVFINPTTGLYMMIFRPVRIGSMFDIGPNIPYSWDAFSYAFPFFLTLIEFFFKKPILERRPYLYIIGFFVLISFVDTKFLLATIAVILLGALPGSVYTWVRKKR